MGNRLNLFAPALPDWLDRHDAPPLDRMDELADALSINLAVAAIVAVRRLTATLRTSPLDGVTAMKALTLDDEAWTAWTAWRKQRKTRFMMEGRTAYLMHAYEVGKTPEVSLAAFRQRIEALSKNGDVSLQDVEAALCVPQSLWQARAGTGRSREFVYDGTAFPEQIGKSFRSRAHFFQVIGKADLKATIWSRLKAGWDLDDAVVEPVLEGRGCIYSLTCRPTGQVYVGLTSVTPSRRFDQHCRAAERGSPALLHVAIRVHGADAFAVALIEEVGDEKALAGALVQAAGAKSPELCDPEDLTLTQAAGQIPGSAP